MGEGVVDKVPKVEPWTKVPKGLRAGSLPFIHQSSGVLRSSESFLTLKAGQCRNLWNTRVPCSQQGAWSLLEAALEPFHQLRAGRGPKPPHGLWPDPRCGRSLPMEKPRQEPGAGASYSHPEVRCLHKLVSPGAAPARPSSPGSQP